MGHPLTNNHASNAIIETHALRREFSKGKVVAVSDLDLTIYKGEIFGLVGPDGSGKTTVLRLLSAIMDPTRGSARIAGFDTKKDPEAIKTRIGYMAQIFSLYRDLSVIENLHFFADVYGVGGKVRQERIERLLSFARLKDFCKRRAGQLSGGMQKKLGLACTLIHEPEILYLDEPTTGVDPVSRREFWDILTDLHVQGVTIVVSTPYMDEAERCSRVGLMYQGRLIECDTPVGIRSRLVGQVLEFHPGDRRLGRDLLRGVPGIREVQSFGELLHVFVDDVVEGQRAIEQVLGEAGLTVRGMRQIEPRMEEAFVSLIRQQSQRETPEP